MEQISAPIADAIELWRLTMKRRDGEDQRSILRKAAVDLFEQLRVDATVVPPEAHAAARKAVAAALASLAQDIPADDARRILEQAEAGDGNDDDDTKDGKKEKTKEPKQADILVAEAQSASLFHTPDGEEFADIIIAGRRETHRIRGSKFRLWLRHQYYLRRGSGCSSEALQTAIETIAAFAQFKGEEHEVHCRVAGHDGAIYIDMGDGTWRAIEVTPIDWKVVDVPPVRFRRSQSTRALPMPVAGGSIKALREFANLKKIDGKGNGGKADAEFVVLVGHILAAMRPNASYPVCCLLGEHGTCKSTLSTIISRLVDPRLPEQRSPPASEEDLIVAATGAHALCYDNISALPDWLSDAFCRLSTGGGTGKRRLYSDNDEILFHGRRPIFLTGIEDYPQRPDLVDRANIFGLEVVPENERLSDSELQQKFTKSAPVILGALLDGLVAGLKYLPEVEIIDKPRMADFVLWAEASTRAYWPAGTFIEAYRKNQAASVELVLEASAVGSAVVRFMDGRDEWAGPATELLEALNAIVGERAAKERDWPKRANTLSGKLRRAAPTLRKGAGINVTFGRREEHAGAKVITIKRAHPEGKGKTSKPSTPQPEQNEKPNKTNAVNGGDGVDQGPNGVDLWPAGVDHGVDVVSIPARTIDTDKPLKNNGGVDGGDGGGLSTFPSVGNGNSRLCIQCGDPIRPGREITIRSTGSGELVAVHEGCLNGWRSQ